ncbi:hypothetical protein [Lactococcus lactis]|uniref:hypothetical protein n=1 Tax=Lactococcus lactis TaxID=1358 RepID=UPI000BA7E1FC|nr:hypothetical protein [Lactococcus lactis]PAK67327.1 hypothetical protein B8W94_06385 [Lactococcus lactis]PEN18803.1 hypothetical protein CRM88_07685 [Lactococcus lactis]USI60480.1 hypothetical protein LP473_10785 [Lactococcus lactis subsp. lactis]
MEIIIWKVIMGILIILNLPMFPWFVKNYNQSGVGDFLANLNWSAIIAVVAVGISLIALWFQRRDLKKQATYQRNTFILQNTLNRDSITFGMAGDIIGNVQTQVQVMKSLYLDKSVLNSWYKEENIDEVRKFERSIDGLSNSLKDLTNELTSKGNTLQFHMAGETVLPEIEMIFSSIQEALSQMIDDINDISNNNEVPTKEELNKKLEKFSSEVLSKLKIFQTIMKEIKLSSLDKLNKID